MSIPRPGFDTFKVTETNAPSALPYQVELWCSDTGEHYAFRLPADLGSRLAAHAREQQAKMPPERFGRAKLFELLGA